MLNGNVECIESTDDSDFYHQLEYIDDADLGKKLVEWEHYYNFHRPHGGLKGKVPCETLKEKIRCGQNV